MYIKIRVATGQKHEKIDQVSDNTFRVLVKEPASHNLANARIRYIFAEYYNTPIATVRIVSGHHKPSKILSINLPGVD